VPQNRWQISRFFLLVGLNKKQSRTRPSADDLFKGYCALLQEMQVVKSTCPANLDKGTFRVLLVFDQRGRGWPFGEKLSLGIEHRVFDSFLWGY
jgi:hypothetical protein